MTFLEQLAPGNRSPVRRAKRTAVGILVASLLVALPLGTASASSVGGTQAQIAALRTQIIDGANRIHELTQGYDDASLQAASLHQQLETQHAQLDTLHRELARSQRSLRQAALQSYTGDAATDVSPSVASTTNPAVGDEYLSIASGDVSNTIDVYQLRQRQVTTAIRAIAVEQRANQRDLETAASARTNALTVAGTEQARLGSLQAQLTAAEHAARAASDVAAMAAAARAAAKTQGLPVNGGLVKVTRSETSPETTPVTSPSVTTSPTTPTTTTPTTTPPTTPPPTTTPPAGGDAGVWLELRTCESGDNYAENTGNGFYGAYQFSAQTWTDLGYPGRPDLEPPAMQDAAAMRLQAAAGWGQWPACAATLGLT